VGTRLRSAVGAAATLHAFFRLCDEAGPGCRFSGDSRHRFQDMARELRSDPLRFGGGFRFTYNDLVAITLSALYSGSAFPDLAWFLRDVERELAHRGKASAARLATSVARIGGDLGLARPQQQYPNFVESFPGVACSDGVNPRDYDLYRTGADTARREMGHFARLWHWALSACAVWPPRAGADQHLGPWTAATPHPVLVVGNYFDPATRYRGAVAASRLLPNSRLLSYAGWGHTAFFSGNFCVDQAVAHYLETLETPSEGAVCQPAGSPFPTRAERAQPAEAAERAVAAERARAGVGALLPASVRRVVQQWSRP
jgi:hypothetical protein